MRNAIASATTVATAIADTSADTAAATASLHSARNPLGALTSVARLALMLALTGSACAAHAEPMSLPFSQPPLQEASSQKAQAAQAAQAARDEAEQAAEVARNRARSNQILAEQEALQAAQAKGKAEAETAVRQEQERQEAARHTKVVRVVGDAGETARAVATATQGRVQCTPLGGSIVLSSGETQLERALTLISALNDAAEIEQLQSQKLASRRREDEQRRKEEEAVQALQLAPPEQRLFDVTLGPTLGESLVAISNALGDKDAGGLNIVFVPDQTIGSAAVRPVELRRVTLRACLSTLTTLLPRNPDNSEAFRIDAEGARVRGERPVVSVSTQPMRGVNSAPLDYETAVFRLQSVHSGLEKEAREEILAEQASMMDAVEVGLGIIGRTKEFKIKLHPETGLMFVHGTSAEIALVAEVLGQPASSSRAAAPAPQGVPGKDQAR